MHSSHCIFHHLFAAAHYCETHRIHLIAYTCSFCLCPRYPARIPGTLSQTHLYAMHLDPSLSVSGRFVFLLFCAYHFYFSIYAFTLFITAEHLSASYSDSVGFCVSRHLIDLSAFYLFPVRSRLDSSFGPFSASLCSCRVPTRPLESTIFIIFLPIMPRMIRTTTFLGILGLDGAYR